MYQIIYLKKSLNKRITATFWSEKSANEFVKMINKNDDLILLAIENNSYMYD